MSNEDKAKELGFLNEQEMLLYKDVCCLDDHEKKLLLKIQMKYKVLNIKNKIILII